MSADIKVLRQYQHTRAPIKGIAGSDDLSPYLDLNVDAEAIAHEATCMARSPKECVLQSVRTDTSTDGKSKLDSRGPSMGTRGSTCKPPYLSPAEDR
jgi:hypothetical protein